MGSGGYGFPSASLCATIAARKAPLVVEGDSGFGFPGPLKSERST